MAPHSHTGVAVCPDTDLHNVLQAACVAWGKADLVDGELLHKLNAIYHPIDDEDDDDDDDGDDEGAYVDAYAYAYAYD